MISRHSDLRRYAIRFGPAVGVAIVYLLFYCLPANKQLTQQLSDCDKVAARLMRIEAQGLDERLCVLKAEILHLGNQMLDHQNSHAAFVASSIQRHTLPGNWARASVTASIVEHFSNHGLFCSSVLPQSSLPPPEDCTAEACHPKRSNSEAASVVKIQLQGGFVPMRRALIEMDQTLMPIEIEAIEMSEVDPSGNHEGGHWWTVTIRLPEEQA